MFGSQGEGGGAISPNLSKTIKANIVRGKRKYTFFECQCFNVLLIFSLLRPEILQDLLSLKAD